MTNPRTPPRAGAHRDRSTGLVIFGIFEVVLGLGCAALIPMTLVAAAFAPDVDALLVIPSLAVNAVVAAIFVILGIGSMRARRWAQALTLSLSWVWLITGLCTMLFSLWFLPAVVDSLGAGSGLDPAAVVLIALGISGFLAVINVALPVAFIFFYRSIDVIETCRLRDPNPGWTGRCPQRLLALAVAYGLGALSILAVPAYGFVFPVFGWVLYGTAGAVCWALAAALSGALAWGTCRRQPWAWWTAVTVSVAAAASSVVSFAFNDPEPMLEAMALPGDQLMLMTALWPREPWIQIVFWLLVWGSLLAYMVVVRPLFNPPLGRGVAAD